MLFIAVACSLIYGVIVGSFSRRRSMVGGAAENFRRSAHLGAHLFAELVHFRVPQRITARLVKSSAWSRGC